MNTSEQIVFDELRADGCQVLRHGWPDFLVISKDGSVRAVEVKQSLSCKLSDNQKAVHDALGKCGVVTEIRVVPMADTRISVQLPPDLWHKLLNREKETQRSRSSIVNDCLAEHLPNLLVV